MVVVKQLLFNCYSPNHRITSKFELKGFKSKICFHLNLKKQTPGIEKGEPNEPARFTINTRGAGLGGVGLSVVGPTEPKVDCVDNQDGTLSVEYLPDSPGDYEIGITFADQPVPGWWPWSLNLNF